MSFNNPVVVEGSPLLGLNAGPAGAGRSAVYAPGGGAAAAAAADIAFLYTVQPGDNAARLDYAGEASLVENGGSIAAANGGQITLRLPSHGSGRSLGDAADIAIDTAAPRVESVASPDPAGTYGAGDLVNITVAFTEPVFVAGRPQLALRMDEYGGGAASAHAAYASGSGTDALAFLYSVRPGDRADDLGYAGRTALSANGGAVADEAGNAADLALPAPGSPGSLSGSADIKIDTAAPRVVSVTSPNDDATHGANAPVNITVAFTEPVFVEGRPQLALKMDEYGGAGGGGGGAASAHAAYASGSGTDALAFLYSVRPGDRADDLGYAGRTALSANGGAVADEAGNAADLALPAPGSALSLSGSKDIAIDAPGTAVDLVSSPDPAGAYGAGSRINITVSFNNPVVVEGSPLLELDTGASARDAEYVPGGGAAAAAGIAFLYTVRPGDNAARLDYAGESSLVETAAASRPPTAAKSRCGCRPPARGGRSAARPTLR